MKAKNLLAFALTQKFLIEMTDSPYEAKEILILLLASYIVGTEKKTGNPARETLAEIHEELDNKTAKLLEKANEMGIL